jgi:hypothetical protein
MIFKNFFLKYPKQQSPGEDMVVSVIMVVLVVVAVIIKDFIVNSDQL